MASVFAGRSIAQAWVANEVSSRGRADYQFTASYTHSHNADDYEILLIDSILTYTKKFFY